DMARSERDALLVRSTIDLAHGLGMQVTAEGVEDETVLALLAVMGCDQAQGFGIARPMPVNELLRYLADNHVRESSEPEETPGAEATVASRVIGAGSGATRLRSV